MTALKLMFAVNDRTTLSSSQFNL